MERPVLCEDRGIIIGWAEDRESAKVVYAEWRDPPGRAFTALDAVIVEEISPVAADMIKADNDPQEYTRAIEAGTAYRVSYAF